MRRLAFGITVFAAIGMAGCAADVRPTPTPRAAFAEPVRYACDDGAFLSVRFQDDTADVTMVDGARAVLSRLRSGAGVRYGSDAYEFWGKGDAATWTAKGSPATACLAT